MKASHSGPQQTPSTPDINPTNLAERTEDSDISNEAPNQQPAFPPIDVEHQTALLQVSAIPGGSSVQSSEAHPTPTDVSETEAEDVPLLTRGDIWFIAVTSTIILALTLYQLYLRYGWGVREIEVLHPADDYHFTLEINSATWVEWMQLEGIGEVLARRIVEHRETHGPFRSIDDVNDVHGIGDATLEKMRPHLRIDPVVDSP